MYALGDPVNVSDPLGQDAIVVVYEGYPVDTGYFDIRLSLGHAAVIAVENESGRTRYYEYGRYGGDFGKVMRRNIPDLKIGEDGLPTKDSLKNLYDYISKKYGKEYPVLAFYHPGADYQKVVAYAEKIKNDPNREPYSIPFNTCYTFAEKAAEAGNK
jgi:hypothetical protein